MDDIYKMAFIYRDKPIFTMENTVETIQNSPDSSVMVAFGRGRQWVCPQRWQATIVANSRTKHNNEAPNSPLLINKKT